MPRGALPADLRRFRFNNRKYHVSFEPRGDVHCCGDPANLKLRRNPVERLDVVPLTARLFVGLNVGQKPTYSVEDAVKLTREIRTRQGALPDASFLAQRGLFTDEKTREIVDENSVQIVVFDFSGDQEFFEAQIEELAEELAQKFQQQVIYVEMQKAGVPYTVLRVT